MMHIMSKNKKSSGKSSRALNEIPSTQFVDYVVRDTVYKPKLDGFPAFSCGNLYA